MSHQLDKGRRDIGLAGSEVGQQRAAQQLQGDDSGPLGSAMANPRPNKLTGLGSMAYGTRPAARRQAAARGDRAHGPGT